MNYTLENCLEDIYGYKIFRDKQKDITENVINGKDVLAILPTGYGKVYVINYQHYI